MLNSVLVHWRALCILYGSLLASTAFAVGHHFYYQSLAGQPVSTENELAIGSWAGVPSQKFNTAVGNTLASFFRTSLSITVTTAYCQIVWRALKASTTEVNIVDAISGILTNPLGFLNLGAWSKSALLFPLAIAIWLLPIASIFTPATLTVITASRTSYDLADVPSIDFNSQNFPWIVLNSDGCTYEYRGTSFEVQRFATAAVGQGAVLSINAPGNRPNVSYTQQFGGPVLQCSDVRDPLRGEILDNVNTTSWDDGIPYAYLAWSPTDTSSMPFQSGLQSNGQHLLQPIAIGPQHTPGAPEVLFVASLPSFRSPRMMNQMDPNWDYIAKATIVQCSLVNATYSAMYNWTNGVRDLTVTTTPSGRNVSHPNSHPERVGCTDSRLDSAFIQDYTYTAVLEAFMNIIRGYVSAPTPNGLVTGTEAMNTALGTTQELFALRNQTAGGVRALDTLGQQYWPGVTVELQANSTSNLRPILELMFQNLTMSLMSSPLLQPDHDTPHYPPPVNITIVTYYSQYEYAAAMLGLAYGTAVLMATIIVVLGCIAIFSSGLSYSSSFSTVLRTTSHASVSTEISREDAVGQDPLPKHLAEATITFEHVVRAREIQLGRLCADDRDHPFYKTDRKLSFSGLGMYVLWSFIHFHVVKQSD
ncbi:uncharacterized protein M437DRAFT_72949 [Aureobasidium melanogenum CBS 110374]|uniref:Uncharacterized protein n=1 Tax=Aureobasidium melanogenum (strain CBS 110374) TaxID=1043003 RepID=A0A074W3R2_AURM1|nr:uncharacterized protein M437DRAFT_72949 [Aureobasidium melanogenum CBS 110374]KEQ66144.1 hypothetical protein M437DRAFT_72949 [Aureobasidium melanogenum CBS 110374]